MNIHPSQRTACHSSSSPTSPRGMITADIDAHACDMFTFSDPMCDHACDASARAWKTHKELLAEAKKTIELLTAFESTTASQATTSAVTNASAMETSTVAGAGAGQGLEMATTGTTTGAQVDTNPAKKKRGRPRGSKTKHTTGIAVERVVRKPPVSIAPKTGVEMGFCTSCKRRLPLKDHFQEGRRTCLNCLSWHKLYARRTRRFKRENLNHENDMASKLQNAGDAAPA